MRIAWGNIVNSYIIINKFLFPNDKIIYPDRWGPLRMEIFNIILNIWNLWSLYIYILKCFQTSCLCQINVILITTQNDVHWETRIFVF